MASVAVALEKKTASAVQQSPVQVYSELGAVTSSLPFSVFTSEKHSHAKALESSQCDKQLCSILQEYEGRSQLASVVAAALSTQLAKYYGTESSHIAIIHDQAQPQSVTYARLDVPGKVVSQLVEESHSLIQACIGKQNEFEEFFKQNKDFIPQVLLVVITDPANSASTQQAIQQSAAQAAQWHIIIQKQPDGSYNLSVSYEGASFEAEYMKSVLTQLGLATKWFASNLNQLASKVSLLSADEYDKVINKFAGFDMKLPNVFFYDQIRDMAKKYPNNKAVGCKRHYLSYQKFNEKSNQLANYLISKGVGRKSVVGMYLDRSVDMTIALNGISRSGAAYVPMDPIYPLDRISAMVQDGDVKVVVTTSNYAKNLATVLPEGIQLISVDQDAPQISEQSSEDFVVKDRDLNDVAYVMFTSGSTGRPKGVQVSHNNIQTYIFGHSQQHNLTPEDRTLSITTVTFDVFLTDYVLALTAGACVTIATDEQMRDPALLAELLLEADITLCATVPSLAGMLVQSQWPGKKDLTLNCAGEALKPALAADLLPLVGTLYNYYGPTEATIYTSFEKIVDPTNVTIGKCLPNYRFYVLDEHLQPLPVGVAGQLYIGGPGVTQGYKNRDDLTSQKFQANPFHTGRIYNTGDLGRWNSNGDMECLGRSDNQIKIRGYRVELDEIEAVLQEHMGVREAVVRTWIPEGASELDKKLVAYVVKQGQSQSSLTAATPEGGNKDHDEINLWTEIYDEAYDSQNAANEDPTLNFSGYDNSYTPHIPHQSDVIREWVEGCCTRVDELKPTRIVELGCGQGMILFRSARSVERYVGVDISQSAVKYIQSVMDAQPAHRHPHVSLHLGGAHDALKFKDDKPDVVVCNGVSMYFPSPAYMQEVVQGSLESAGDEGRFFLGDVRNNDLLQHFHASVKLFGAPDNQSVGELVKTINQSMKREKEFLVEPEYFVLLARDDDCIGNIRVDMKRGAHVSEFSMYRYDVTFWSKNNTIWSKDLKTYTFNEYVPEQHSIDALQKHLSTESPEVFAINNVPDGRISHEGHLVHKLNSGDLPATCGELRSQCDELLEQMHPLMPEDLYQLGESLGYHVEMLWTPNNKVYMDVLFVKREAVYQYEPVCIAQRRAIGTYPELNVKEPIMYTNKGTTMQDEGDADDNAVTVDDIRGYKTHLRRRVPEYMVPTVYVAVDALPLTANGKVDRKRMQDPSDADIALAAGHGKNDDYVAPNGLAQEKLAEWWGEMLRLVDVSATDDFFLAGGHSLLAIQLTNKISKQFAVKISMQQLLQNSVLAQMAELINESSSKQTGKYDSVTTPEFNVINVTDLPFQATTQPHCWVPMKDGVRLAARTWVPTKEGSTFPTIVEISPYRKADMMVEVDELTYPYLSGHGIVCLRVDTRGTGDSEGICTDEYTVDQTDDTAQVIEWAATQAWSNGQVFVMGQSWSGFVGLQVASLPNPPQALKGIIVCHATDDRYSDDMHYQGGALIAENLSWGSLFVHCMSQPPDPKHVGSAWLDIWQERIRNLTLPYVTWMQHPFGDDDYWRSGSACYNPESLRVPILAVGGANAGSYKNSISRLASNFPNSDVTCLYGPWAHNFPHLSSTGPAYGFLQEVLTWMATVLNKNAGLTRVSSTMSGMSRDPSYSSVDQLDDNDDNNATAPASPGVFPGAQDQPNQFSSLVRSASWLSTGSTDTSMDAKAQESRYTLYAQRPGVVDKQGSAAVVLPGVWLSFKSQNVLSRATARNCLQLGEGGQLLNAGTLQSEHTAVVPQGLSVKDGKLVPPVGLEGGRWFTFGTMNDLPVEQVNDDKQSLVYDSEVVQADTLLVSNPKVTLNLQASEGQYLAGHLIARLNAVDPDGHSYLLTYGASNLDTEIARKLADAKAKVNGAVVPIVMNTAAYVIPKGWRLRMAISRVYFPIVWPSTTPGGQAPITVKSTGSIIELHVAPMASKEVQYAIEKAGDVVPQALHVPNAPQQARTKPATTDKLIDIAEDGSRVSMKVVDDRGSKVLQGCAEGLTFSSVVEEEYSVELKETDRVMPKHKVTYTTKLQRGDDYDTESKYECEMTCSKGGDEYFLVTRVQSLHKGRVIADREWESSVPVLGERPN